MSKIILRFVNVFIKYVIRKDRFIVPINDFEFLAGSTRFELILLVPKTSDLPLVELPIYLVGSDRIRTYPYPDMY